MIGNMQMARNKIIPWVIAVEGKRASLPVKSSKKN
jgi:hypothetical protein